MLSVIDLLLRIGMPLVIGFILYAMVIEYQMEKERERKIALKRKAQRLMRERGI